MSFSVSLAKDDAFPEIAVITIDNPPVNAMSPGVPGAIIDRLAEANADDSVQGIVLAAAGNGGLAGADIKMQGKKWPDGEPNLPALIVALDGNAKPVAMLIRRHALGGGLEIAMGCHYRVAVPGTKLGQPEVKLGIPPGAGGTQRLPRLVGVKPALDMIVSGDSIDAAKGHEIGLVDAVVDSDGAVAAAAAFVAGTLDGEVRAPVSSLDVEATDPQVFEDARKAAARRYRGQRSQQVAIDCVEAATKLPFDEGMKFEREQFVVCVASDEAAALRHVFAAERKAARVPGIGKDTPLREINKAAVIGAGTMGGGIAMCFANAGIPATVIEREQAALDRGFDRMRKNYEVSAKRGRLTMEQVDQRMGLLHQGLSLEDVADADIVIEAVFEEMDVKKQVFGEIAQHARGDAILATNTSYLDVDEIAKVTNGRETDVLGLHFFSPANVMKLLEIVRADKTADDVLATSIKLGQRLSKVGVVAGVCHGFIGNRLLELYAREAEFLLEEGASPQQVDRVLLEFGMAMGVFAVRDLAGLDISWAKRKANAHLRKPDERYSRIGDAICERGWFGQKTGRGFYLYEEGGRTPTPDPEVDAIIAECAKENGIEQREISDEEIIARCLYPIINEGARELEEGIALRASDIDLVWINGYGFPRWRGGPMCWADRIGLDKVLEQVKAFDQQHQFWAPSDLLVKLVEDGKSFADWDAENA